MATRTACRRRVRRYSVAGSDSTVIEFDYPTPGSRAWRVPLIDLSVSGFSFAFAEEAPDLESGSSLDQVVLKIGECEIRGDCLVMHLTRESEFRTVCGALFYPATDVDLLKLKSLIAGLGAAQGKL